jgi:hypothetical protein
MFARMASQSFRLVRSGPRHLALGLLTAGAAAVAPAPEAETHPTRVGCGDAVEETTTDVDRARDAVLGPLVIYGARRTVGREPDAFDGHGYKLPVTLRDGVTATLAVPRAGRSRVGLVFTPGAQRRASRDGVPGADPSVRFKACKAGGDTGRTGWAGGLVVDRPRCATLVVRVAGGRTVRRRVPLGEAC